jgi:prolipoprotein diacylglyceryltransferase
MIVIIGMIAGGLFGVRNAKRRGGDRKDMAQYGIVGVIVGGLVGLFVTIGVEKLL